MKSLGNKFRQLDTFGEPVQVNYKGESTYKTSLGACCSLMLLWFILGYGTFTFLKVIAYQDPQITQVSVHIV